MHETEWKGWLGWSGVKKLLKFLLWLVVGLAARCGNNSASVPSAEEFYVDKLERKYARVSHCC